MKGNGYEADDWKVRNKELYVDEKKVAIKEGLPSSMWDEMEDNQEDNCSLTYEYWCDLLSTIEVKDNRRGQQPKSRILLLLKRNIILTETDPL